VTSRRSPDRASKRVTKCRVQKRGGVCVWHSHAAPLYLLPTPERATGNDGRCILPHYDASPKRSDEVRGTVRSLEVFGPRKRRFQAPAFAPRGISTQEALPPRTECEKSRTIQSALAGLVRDADCEAQQSLAGRNGEDPGDPQPSNRHSEVHRAALRLRLRLRSRLTQYPTAGTISPIVTLIITSTWRWSWQLRVVCGAISLSWHKGKV
jgi:hypothetical protein